MAIDTALPQTQVPPPAAVEPIDRYRLDAAMDRIGHLGKPAFRARIADAYDAAATDGQVS